MWLKIWPVPSPRTDSGPADWQPRPALALGAAQTHGGGTRRRGAVVASGRRDRFNLFVRNIELARRLEAAQRVRAEDRQREGEQLINFMLGDLADRLQPVGRLDVLESTISQVDQFYAKMPADQMTPKARQFFSSQSIIPVRGHPGQSGPAGRISDQL